jgi:large subunit ribosomal protein L28
MSRICQLMNKRPRSANKVSHSFRRTKRVQVPNIQHRRVWVPELGQWVKIRISAAGLKTIDKVGLLAYAQEQGLRLKDLK